MDFPIFPRDWFLMTRAWIQPVICSGGWWRLPDEPGSSKPSGGWKSPGHPSNSWKHIWPAAHIAQREQWGFFCLQWGDDSHQIVLWQLYKTSTFVTGARFHGRGLPAEVEPDASQFEERWWVDKGEVRMVVFTWPIIIIVGIIIIIGKANHH